MLHLYKFTIPYLKVGTCRNSSAGSPGGNTNACRLRVAAQSGRVSSKKQQPGLNPVPHEDGFWGGKTGSKYLLRRYLDPLGNVWRKLLGIWSRFLQRPCLMDPSLGMGPKAASKKTTGLSQPGVCSQRNSGRRASELLSPASRSAEGARRSGGDVLPFGCAHCCAFKCHHATSRKTC